MDNSSNVIKNVLENSNFTFTETMMDQFVRYAKQLVEWNSKINLTAITDPREIAIKHFVDSLSVLDAFEIPYGAKVIDVGTGAGFPGVPLKIVRPDINLTLLDSLNKRLIFLEDLMLALNLKADLIHSRAEDAARMQILRESYDVVVSRAVAPLNVLLEYCIPFINVNGIFIAMKGSNADAELENSKNAMKCLKVKVVDIKVFSLIDKNDRSIIVFKKYSELSNIYPRHSSKISKKPL